jgi:hypothetical protein
MIDSKKEREEANDRLFPRTDYPYDCCGCGNRCKGNFDIELRGKLIHSCAMRCLQDYLKIITTK